MKRLLLCLGASLLIVAGAFLFREEISSRFYSYCIHAYCKHHLGTPLQTSSIYKNDGYLIFENPELIHNGTTLKAGKLLVNASFRPLLRTMEIQLIVEDSHIDFQNEITHLQKIFQEIISKTFPYWLFKIHLDFSIDKGKLSWRENSLSHEANFKFSATSKSEFSQILLSLFLESENRDSNLFELELEKKRKMPLDAHLRFHQVDCCKMSRIYESFGNSFEGWKITQGEIDGNIYYRKAKKGRGIIWGEALLKDIGAENPFLQIKGHIPKGILALQKQKHEILGEIVLEKGVSFSLFNRGICYLKSKNFGGEIRFIPDKKMRAKFLGKTLYEGQEFGVEINSLGDIHEDITTRISWNSPYSAKKKVHMQLKGKLPNEEKTRIEIDFSNFAKEEWELVKNALFASFTPPEELKALRIEKGDFAAKGTFGFQNGSISDIKIDKIEAEKLRLAYEPLDLSLKVENIKGNLEFHGCLNNLQNAPSLFDTLDGDVLLQEGQLKFSGLHGKIWHLDHLNTNLSIRNGFLQQSQMHGFFEGMKADLTLDWHSPLEFIKISLSGLASNLGALIPTPFANGIEKAFPEDEVKINGSIVQKSSKTSFQGNLAILERLSEKGDIINFGFDIEKSSEKFEALGFLENIAETAKGAFPPIIAPALLLSSEWINKESGIGGFVIRNGWFKTGNLPLRKYVSPFIFGNDEAHIEGQGIFKGNFDHKTLNVSYKLENICIENPYLTFKGDKKHPMEEGVHYFDLERGLHYGTIPLKRASYKEKSSGLLFNEIDALVILEGSRIHFSRLKTDCQEIILKGMVDVDFDKPHDGYFNLSVKMDGIQGTWPQVKNILSKFDPNNPFLDFPLRGDVTLLEPGAKLTFAFEPEKFKFDAQVYGAFSNGECSFKNAGINIKNGKCHFAYDHNLKSFLISNIFGNVFLEKGKQKYAFSGEYINFQDYSKNAALFDVWLGDQNRDIIRLVGKTHEEEVNGPHRISFHLDREHSHIGNMRPTNFLLSLNKGYDIERCSLGLDVSLKNFLQDLNRLKNGGLFSSLKNIEKGISEIRSASGEVKLNLIYRGKEDELTYRMKGYNISFNDHIFDKFLISGRKIENSWFIDKLKLDDFSILAKALNKNDDWHLELLKLHYGEKLYLELSGDYYANSNKIKADIASLDLDMSLLNTATSKKLLAKGCLPHGKFQAKGSMEADFFKNSFYKVEAILNTSLTSWGIGNLYFQDVQDISCYLNSPQGITFRNLDVSLITPELKLNRGSFFLEKATYGFESGDLAFEGGAFQIPAHHLPWVADTINENFPEWISKESWDIIKNCKLQGFLEGILNYEYTSPYSAMRVKLQDGNYCFLNMEHNLKNFVIEYDPFEFKMASKYELDEESIWVYARSTSPNLSHGELILADHFYENRPENKNQPLVVLWENDENRGFSVKQARGYLHGLDFHLKKDPLEPLSSEVFHLIGEVSLNFQKAKSLFPKEMAKKVVDWNMGNGYKMRGKWKYLKKGNEDYPDKIHFAGSFDGNHFSIRGYEFDTLTSNLEYTPKKASFRNLSLSDSSGFLSFEKMDLLKSHEGHWVFSLPELKIHKFKPSLLCEGGLPRPLEERPFVVKELILNTCQGKLADPSSIVGKGVLHFSNKSKKRLQNTIFQIPADILSRIGLDLSVMTPIVGSIEYEIQNGKIHLLKFKDVYSDGKLSKFYLSPSFYSTVDFDGNLRVQVRMKQYNLLFKLAELCTVSIGGNFQKPIWGLE